MIYLSMAMYAEAVPFIQALGLTGIETMNRFRLYVSDNVRLVVSGTGSLSAAIAVTWLCTKYPPQPENDFFAQIGTAGCMTESNPHTLQESQNMLNAKKGNLFLCHKLTDASTGRSFYPDMLYQANFAEAALTTYPAIWNAQKSEPDMTESLSCQASSIALADMEGYGGYQAASVFFPSHRIFTFKVISDFGEINQMDDSSTCLSASNVTELIGSKVSEIMNWIDSLSKDSYPVYLPCQSQNQLVETPNPDSEEKSWQYLKELADVYEYSVTQQHHLTGLLHYARLSGLSGVTLTEGLERNTPPHPAQKKKEGKRILHELEQRIIPK